MSKAAVSKSMARLEARLGTALLNRTSRKLSLTDTGRRMAGEAAALLAQAVALERSAAAEATLPAGLVRIAAPMTFGVMHLAPLLPELLELYPALEIDLHLSDDVADVTGEGFDLALRIAALADSSLRVRQLCRVRRTLVAAPAYIARRGMPTHPHDLRAHECLGYSYLATGQYWRFRDPGGADISVRAGGRARMNNGEAMMPLLLAGFGLAILPDFTMLDHLRAGRLVRVMPGFQIPSGGLNILTQPGGPRATRVTAVIEFLAKRLANTSW
jgi:DNA-binding transcriptional LysR family regulator